MNNQLTFKRLVTKEFREKLLTIFPSCFSYNCCEKGTHERFLQTALFSTFIDKVTGATLFNQEMVARIANKVEKLKDNHFVAGPILNHLLQLLPEGTATLYTNAAGYSYSPGQFATAEELNEYEVIKKGRLVMDTNPNRKIKITEGFCRQVTFSWPEEIKELLSIEKNKKLSKKSRYEKVNIVTGELHTARKQTSNLKELEEETSEIIDILDNKFGQQIARYMNELPVGHFEDLLSEEAINRTMKVVNTLPTQVREQQLNILNAIADQPKVFYRPSRNGNTDRLFGNGPNITNLKKEVRKALTKDWVECDAKNLHLAIVGKLWKIESLQSFLSKGNSFWKYIQNALQVEGEDSKKYIKEATYGLVYGMSKKNLEERLDSQLGMGMGKKFLNISLIKDILSARKEVINYHMNIGEIEDCFGTKFAVTKENILSLLSRVCQSYELKLIRSIYKLTDKCNEDFIITLYQFDGLSIKFNCNRDKWIEEITEEFNNAALEMGIFTSLSWSLLDDHDRVCTVEASELSEACSQYIQEQITQGFEVSDVQVFRMVLMQLWNDLDIFLGTYNMNRDLSHLTFTN